MKRIATIFHAAIACTIFAALVGTGCSKDEPTRPPVPDPSVKDDETAEIDRWMFDYMKTHYLWNGAVRQVKPDYDLEYEKFLDDVLNKVAAQNDANHDDGHWTNGKRSYFYSNIQRYKNSTAALGGGVRTRGTREQAEGLGIEMLFYAPLDKAETRFVFIIAAVTPDSPAAKAGLQRGDLISRVDGAQIKQANLNACWTKLMSTESGTVRLTPYDMDASKDGAEISVAAASYDDNPIWLRKTIATDYGTKVGYLCYGSFNYHYDEELIDAFKRFNMEKIDELVLDLRYNGGGHVVSSVVLGTLVAGNAHKGGIYARTTYNADRKNETVDIYKLGVAQYNAGNPKARHDLIAAALTSAIGLERVYVLCTGSTASASELVINGLRGLDIEVRLIGSTTNGKNVGMEPQVKTFGDYEYDFSPITFYIANAKGFRDYGNGFEPEAEADDTLFYFDEAGTYHAADWGDEKNDEMLSCALARIDLDRRPAYPQQTAATRGSDVLRPCRLQPMQSPRVQDMLRLPEPEE